MKRSYLVCVLTFFLWGSVYVFSKYAMEGFSPFTVVAIRNTLGILFIAAITPRGRYKKVKREHIKYFIITGVLGYFLGNGMVMYSIRFMSSTTSSLINSANPICIMLLAVLLLGEKMTLRKGLGIACALVGVVLVIGFDGGAVTGMGILCSVFGVMFGALGSVMIRKVSPHYCPEQISILCFLCSLPFCMVCAAAESVHEPMHITLPDVAAVLYLGVFATGTANLLWNKTLAVMEATLCSMFYPLQPVFSAVLGVILFGDDITPNLVCGAVLIFTGAMIGLGILGNMRGHGHKKLSA